MTVLFHKRARAHLNAISAHIEVENPSAAANVVARINEVIETLETFPEMGHQLRRRRQRMMTVTPYPYVIIYRSVGDDLQVLQILHSARRRPALQESSREFRAAV